MLPLRALISTPRLAGFLLLSLALSRCSLGRAMLLGSLRFGGSLLLSLALSRFPLGCALLLGTLRLGGSLLLSLALRRFPLGWLTKLVTDDLVGKELKVPTLYEQLGVRTYVSMLSVHRGATYFSTVGPNSLSDQDVALALF